jgi:hypothetical protein
MQFFWISEYIYFATIGLVKTSFLIFYLQIFPLKQFRTVVWTCIVVNLTATLACSIAAIFVCSPISFAWTQWDGEHKGHCVSNNNLAFAHAGIGIVMDFVTLALPITQIWNLHMSTKKKLGVLLMFSVGAFVTIISILRLRSLVHFAKTQNMTCMFLISHKIIALLIGNRRGLSGSQSLVLTRSSSWHYLRLFAVHPPRSCASIPQDHGQLGWELETFQAKQQSWQYTGYELECERDWSDDERTGVAC